MKTDGVGHEILFEKNTGVGNIIISIRRESQLTKHLRITPQLLIEDTWNLNLVQVSETLLKSKSQDQCSCVNTGLVPFVKFRCIPSDSFLKFSWQATNIISLLLYHGWIRIKN